MTETELRERIMPLEVTVFGHEGQGGLVREVEAQDKRLVKVEKTVNTISIKYIALVTGASSIGSVFFAYLINQLPSLATLFGKH